MKLGLERLAIALLILAEVAGGFALGRLGPAFDVGLWGAVRPWLVALAAVTAVLAHIRIGFPRRNVLGYAVGISLLHVLLLLSLFWSARTTPDPEEVLNVVVLVLAMPVAALVFAEDTERRQDWILKLLFVLGVLSLPVALAGFSSVSSELSLQTVGSIRIARTAGLGAVAALALGLRSRSWVWLIPVPFWVLVMLASGNRASLLALGVAGIPLLFSTRRVQALSGGAIMALVAALVVLTVPVAGEIVRFFFQEAIWEADGRIYLADRGVLFWSAWTLFLRSPWFGHGLGGYGALAGTYYDYPHNLSFSFATELGVLGLVPYAVLLVLAVKAFGRSRTPTHLGMAGIFAYLFVASQFSGSYGDAFLMWVAAVAVMAAPRKGELSEAPTEWR